jgi:glutathione S-transferase
MNTILLDQHPLSPYAQKVRILLREKGLAFECSTPEGLGSGADNSDFVQRNPRFEVPALTHNGATIFDSTIILEYLEECFPEPPMMPVNPVARARMRMIEEVCDTHFEAINWGLGELRFFGRGDEALRQRLHATAVEQVGQMHAWLETLLGGEPWLSGASFGWGDLCALPYVTMSRMFGISPSAGSSLEAWLERSMQRPSVAQTVEEALAVVPIMETRAQSVISGSFKRHYRDHRLEWMIRSGGLQVVLDGLADDNIRFTDLTRFAEWKGNPSGAE